ncbi:thioredoxin domain-containing protein [Parerythrobacter aurantius]|uniref:DsbA family protein n=1 Tax=Parerythrobacter aurantius TaxID=3127706 RepID=UPI00324B302F
MTLRQLALRATGAGLAIFAGVALSAQTQNWVNTVERGEASHVIGDPAAPRLLTEFVSYTCPACANFSRTGEEVVKLGYVAPGKVRFEVRYIQRNEIDIAMTMAAWCGGKDKFKGNHTAIMWSQPQWLPKAQKPTAQQQTRWFTGPGPAKRRAIMWDLDIYQLLEPRGISRGDLDACMADDRFAAKLSATSTADMAKYGINSTPSFALDGKTLPKVHDWSSLAPVLAGVPSPLYGPQ